MKIIEFHMRNTKITELNVRIMKNMKIIKVHMRKTKIMKMLKFESRILKLMKTIIISCENHKIALKFYIRTRESRKS